MDCSDVSSVFSINLDRPEEIDEESLVEINLASECSSYMNQKNDNIYIENFRSHKRNSSDILTHRLNEVSYSDFLQALHGGVNSADNSTILVKGMNTTHRRNRSEDFDSKKEGRNLPIYGTNPCMAYCSSCSTQVHTVVDFYKDHSFLSQFFSFFTLLCNCCSVPAWLNKLRVHKCPYCSEILARI